MLFALASELANSKFMQNTLVLVRLANSKDGCKRLCWLDCKLASLKRSLQLAVCPSISYDLLLMYNRLKIMATVPTSKSLK